MVKMGNIEQFEHLDKYDDMRKIYHIKYYFTFFFSIKQNHLNELNKKTGF